MKSLLPCTNHQWLSECHLLLGYCSKLPVMALFIVNWNPSKGGLHASISLMGQILSFGHIPLGRGGGLLRTVTLCACAYWLRDLHFAPHEKWWTLILLEGSDTFLLSHYPSE